MRKLEHEIKNALEAVRCEEELREKTTAYLKAQRQKRTKSAPGPAFRRLAQAACVLAVLLAVGTFQFLRVPTAYVSIDVNPSIELTLNRLGSVTEAKAYNDDGSRVLQGLTLRGMKMVDAVEQILSAEAMQPYLTEKNDLTFTVAAKDPRQEEQILSDIARQTNQGSGCHGEMDLVEPAHQAGMSMGKYRAVMELNQYDSAMTVERCADMTMAQIHACIRERAGGHHGAAQQTPQGTDIPETTEQETTASCETQPASHGKHHGGKNHH